MLMDLVDAHPACATTTSAALRIARTAWHFTAPTAPSSPIASGGISIPTTTRSRSARESSGTDAAHARHFVETLRTRKPSYADVEVGHRSTIVPHLGNIAFKTGMKLHWDSAKEQFTSAPEANRMLGRAARKPWDLI